MSLIKARTNRVRSVRHICRLLEPNRDTLLLYAAFIGDTADYVLNQVIETTIGKDRDFLTWRVDHPTLPSRPPRPRTDRFPSARQDIHSQSTPPTDVGGNERDTRE